WSRWSLRFPFSWLFLLEFGGDDSQGPTDDFTLNFIDLFREFSSACPVGPTNVGGRPARVNGYARPLFCQLAQTTYQALEIEQVAIVEFHCSLLVEDELELGDIRANEINIIPGTLVWNGCRI